MENEEIVLTKEGKQKLEEELEFLETEKRDEISERIKVAREFGDISENSEYDDAKNEQARVEARIAEIRSIIINSTIVKKPSGSSDEVSIGSTVKIEMVNTEREFKIVGGVESDIVNGKISNSSPVGAALLGHKKGDEVVAIGPKDNKIKIKVLEVKN